MEVFYFLVSTVCLLQALSHVCLSQELRGPICMDCTNNVDPTNCKTVKECWPGESCFSEELRYGNGTRVFNFGCKKTLECSKTKRFVSNGIVIHLCHQCCTSDLCNMNTNCYNVADLVCYTCQNLSDPRDCFQVNVCGDEESCYSETHVSDSPLPLHNMGCVSNRICDLTSRSSLLEKRGENICQKCCQSNGCNVGLCST